MKFREILSKLNEKNEEGKPETTKKFASQTPGQPPQVVFDTDPRYDGVKIAKELDPVGGIKHQMGHALARQDKDADGDVDSQDKHTPDEVTGAEKKSQTLHLLKKGAAERAHTKKGVAYEGYIPEKLTLDDPVGTWIKDFQKSDAPQFAGKSADERKKMALAAYYSRQKQNESISEEALDLSEDQAEEWKRIQSMDKGSLTGDKDGVRKKLSYLNAVLAFQRKHGKDTLKVKKDIERINRSRLAEEDKMKGEDPCWDDYEMVGHKMKNGKKVPNCVPKEDVELDESDDEDIAKAAHMHGFRHGREGVGNNMDRAKKEWGRHFKHYNAGFLKGRNEKAKNLKAVGQGYGKRQQGMPKEDAELDEATDELTQRRILAQKQKLARASTAKEAEQYRALKRKQKLAQAKRMSEDVELEEGLLDTIKRGFATGMQDNLKKSIKPEHHHKYDFDSVKSVGDAKKVLVKAKQSGHLKEAVDQISESEDKTLSRLKQLVRFGLMDKSKLPVLSRAMKSLEKGQVTNPSERTTLFELLNELIGLITGDDAMFAKVRMNVQKEEFEQIIESHFKVGDEVVCKDSGMEGEIVEVDPEEEGKYYTVKREDGKLVKYAPDELELEDDDDDDDDDHDKKELDENAPSAPSLMKHRIAVTVSDPNHTMVSKRNEKIQKFVVVTHSDNKDGAKKVGEKYYTKKGYKVHGSEHTGMVK